MRQLHNFFAERGRPEAPLTFAPLPGTSMLSSVAF
jgi:hypothetical protein